MHSISIIDWLKSIFVEIFLGKYSWLDTSGSLVDVLGLLLLHGQLLFDFSNWHESKAKNIVGSRLWLVNRCVRIVTWSQDLLVIENMINLIWWRFKRAIYLLKSFPNLRRSFILFIFLIDNIAWHILLWLAWVSIELLLGTFRGDKLVQMSTCVWNVINFEFSNYILLFVFVRIWSLRGL